NEALERSNAKDFGLVTPYLGNVQDAIVANYRRSGLNVTAERHLDLQINFSFSEVTEDEIARLVREVAQSRPEAITTFCTNLRAAHLVPRLEEEIGIPIYDTVSTVIWKQLRMAGIDTRQVRGWGQLFQKLP